MFDAYAEEVFHALGWGRLPTTCKHGRQVSNIGQLNKWHNRQCNIYLEILPSKRVYTAHLVHIHRFFSSPTRSKVSSSTNAGSLNAKSPCVYMLSSSSVSHKALLRTPNARARPITSGRNCSHIAHKFEYGTNTQTRSFVWKIFALSLAIGPCNRFSIDALQVTFEVTQQLMHAKR